MKINEFCLSYKAREATTKQPKSIHKEWNNKKSGNKQSLKAY